MRCLIVTGLFYPSKLGGPAKTVYWIAKSLVSSGLSVKVVTTNRHIEDPSVKFNKWTWMDNIQVMYCSSSILSPLKTIYHSIAQMRVCDVLILSSFCYYPNFFVALFFALSSQKIIWSPRGELFESAINDSKLKLLYFKLIKLLFAKRVIFHATSEEEVNRLKKHLGENIKTELIPNYIELPEKKPRIETGNDYFLYVGRIAPIKALDNLIIGLSKSTKFIESNVKLLIAGEVENKYKNYYNNLLQIIADHPNLSDKISFLGNIDGDEKYELYANAFCTVLLSHSENFGNVIVESLSQGTPVIASKGTPWNQLNEYKAGYWIDNNPDQISKTVNLVLSLNKEEYIEIRDGAYKLALQYDISVNIDNWIKVIKNRYGKN